MSLSTTLFIAFLLHLLGDYVLQSDWMATRKVKPTPNTAGKLPHSHGESWLAAAAHAAMYTVPFLLITQSPLALLIIGGTHLVIDHWRLARWVVWARNHIGRRATWVPRAEVHANSGSGAKTPAGLATAVMIVTDNTIHLIINTLTLWWLA